MRLCRKLFDIGCKAKEINLSDDFDQFLKNNSASVDTYLQHSGRLLRAPKTRKPAANSEEESREKPNSNPSVAGKENDFPLPFKLAFPLTS